MMKFNNIFFLTILMVVSTNSFSFITVGTGGAGVCDFDNLQDAYTASVTNNDAFIRVTTEQTYNGILTVTTPLYITGGYADCGAADSNTTGSSLSQWDGENNTALLDINVNSILPLVAIENFRVFNGRDISFEGAGGIKVRGGTSLSIINSQLDNNIGNQGGGVRVSGNNAGVTLHNSSISTNTANAEGAGVYCDNGASFTMTGNSSINANTTVGNGGGIFAGSDCQILVESGSVPDLFGSNFGIYANTANRGAGVYLQDGSDMNLTGNDVHPASIALNQSTTSDIGFGAIGGGAGVFATGNGTTFTAVNAYIESNVSSNFAAGIAIYDNAEFNMTRLSNDCWDNEKCSSLSKNIVSNAGGNSGAGIINANSSADISQTVISENKADEASVFSIQNNSSIRLEGNLITNNKGSALAVAQSTFIIGDIFASGGALVDFYYNTLSSNDSLVSFDIDNNGSQSFLQIFNSIIWETYDVLNFAGAITPSITVNCNIINEQASLLAVTTLTDTVSVDPEFINSNSGNFHLLNQSPAIDLCNENTTQSLHNDLNSLPRGIDNPAIDDVNGLFDAGAYEHKDVLVYSVGGTVTGLTFSSSLKIKLNGANELSISSPGNFVFPTSLLDDEDYEVTISNQPVSENQNCTITQNGVGTIAGENVSDVQIECEFIDYIIQDDAISMFEDTNINTGLQFGIFANDEMPEPLSVLTTGQITGDSLGGLLDISVDGSYIYTPPVNGFGMDTFIVSIGNDNYNDITEIRFNVQPINDAPCASTLGDVDVSNIISDGNQVVRIPRYFYDYSTGPDNEIEQLDDYWVEILSDDTPILTSAFVDEDGDLLLDFNLNYGEAILTMVLLDDGGDVGLNTSEVVEFTVTYNEDSENTGPTDTIKKGGFETGVCRNLVVE